MYFSNTIVLLLDSESDHSLSGFETVGNSSAEESLDLSFHRNKGSMSDVKKPTGGEATSNGIKKHR